MNYGVFSQHKLILLGLQHIFKENELLCFPYACTELYSGGFGMSTCSYMAFWIEKLGFNIIIRSDLQHKFAARQVALHYAIEIDTLGFMLEEMACCLSFTFKLCLNVQCRSFIGLVKDINKALRPKFLNKFGKNEELKVNVFPRRRRLSVCVIYGDDGWLYR